VADLRNPAAAGVDDEDDAKCVDCLRGTAQVRVLRVPLCDVVCCVCGVCCCVLHVLAPV